MNAKKICLAALAILFAGGIILSAFNIWQQLYGTKKDVEDFDELRVIALSADNTPEPITTPAPNATPAPIHKRDIAALTEQNPDTAGWIYIEDTNVDYPVMHTPDEPQKYLHLNFDQERSFSGVPFMDARCNRDSDNLLIYGHKMKSGTMFADIVKYLEQPFRDQHPILEWETLSGCLSYEVFAVAQIDKADKWYGFTDAASEAEYNEMINHIISASRYDTGIRPEYGRQLVTLSTCYGSSDDDRLIIVASKVS